MAGGVGMTQDDHKERDLLRELVDFLLEKADWRSDDDKPGWSLLPCEQAIYIEDDWLDRACVALGINPLEGD